jgi:hypothetical protein
MRITIFFIARIVPAMAMRTKKGRYYCCGAAYLPGRPCCRFTPPGKGRKGWLDAAIA